MPAVRSVTITMLPEDVARGRFGDSRSCPVARATRREFRRLRIMGHTGMGVGFSSIHLRRRGDKEDTRIKLPLSVERFIRAFDSEELLVTPGPFVVEVPERLWPA